MPVPSDSEAPRDTPPDSDTIPDAAPDAAPDSCGTALVSTAIHEPADVLLVLDRSGSMSYSISDECSCDPFSNPAVVCADTSNCRTRWASLVAALDTTLSSTPSLHWGLKLFSTPNAGPCEVAASVEVPIRPGSTDLIESQIASAKPAGETPTASAIKAATAYLKTLTDSNHKVILLATDGKPNCGGSPPSVYDEDVAGTSEAVSAAFDAGFLVYVVGIGTGTSAANLDAFAEKGGTGSHLHAQSPDELVAALAAIGAAATCTFVLAEAPPHPDDVAVYFDKNMVPRDANNGWTFGADSQTILLHGSSCDQVRSGSAGMIQALFGCGLPPPPTLP